ncbi:hypothetical protein L6164_025479 [Bauhinia variegata]|uniref:Uncharacterized protein n=1 Tax=Bauhinia variegata TaxID=167791 RepID=A0ACB9M0Q8_BAUVA|nr:hypothetical protein L6164_025479 [Bauhinia variegata]
MASMSLCFFPKALGRPNTQNPRIRRPFIKKPFRNPKPNPKLKSQIGKYRSPLEPVVLSGAEATTYTRLPPKDDYSDSISSSASEVKLSDSTPPKFEDEIDELVSEGEEDEQVNEVQNGNFVGSYEKFEIFEGNGGFEFDKYDDEEENDEILGFKHGKNVNIYNGHEDDEFTESQNGEVMILSDGEGNFEGDVKEKGVPAVMRCFDRAKIYVKAGDGGNGVVAFRREKYVPLGGPSGGDGGRGGNVYIEVDGSMNSLLPFRNSVHFRAGRGAHGQGRMQAGAKGEDVVVKVAPGTVIRQAGEDEMLLELLHPAQRALLLPGGRGGRGNASFKSGNNKVPRIAENGEEGPEMWLELELKLVADVGIVGAPNAGKSTLLSVISAAKPTVANYPFTTLLPNLGVVSFHYDSTMVVADLPGLLEGAHQGYGLGHEFLRHTERCLALVHVVDGSAPQPDLEFDAVRLELELFSPKLAEKPYIVAYNKMDLLEARENWPSFKERLQSRGVTTFCMSAAKSEGTREVSCAAYELLHKSKEAKEDEDEGDLVNLNHVAYAVQKQRNAAISDFEIIHDSNSNTWHVIGSRLQCFIQMTNWRYIDSERRFQHVLEACGVNKSLLKLGVKEGDTVFVGEMEMVWHDSSENSGPSSLERRSTNSIKWADWK